MEYRQDLIEKVRNGEAQIQVEKTEEHNEMLNYIFPNRNHNHPISGMSVFYWSSDERDGYNCKDWANSSLPIIPAKDFLIQEPEVNWVEVREGNSTWSKRILVADLGEKVIGNRFVCVSSQCNEKYIKGEKYTIALWEHMRPASWPEPLTHAEIEKLIGKPFKYVEG